MYYISCATHLCCKANPALSYPLSYDMVKDARCQKMKFRLTENICNRIFEEMQGGTVVYTSESFGTCDDVVSTIRESKQCTEKALQTALNRLGIEDSSDAIRKTLESRDSF